MARPDPESLLAAGLADRYRLEAEVGRGGMAIVYRARDLRHQRNVAIKVLRPDLRAIIDPARFLREIRITSQLQHPNILPLFDSGEVNGVLYYVMPFVEGESLAQRLERRGRLDDAEALALTRELCDALAYAHRQGVVHRDLKPGNVLLSDGHVLLGDFGIAHAVQGDQTRITQSSLILGTPAYMSPEQARGAATDHRADLYALGIVVYEMLSGALPFKGPTPHAMLALRLADPPQPLRQLRPDLPGAVFAAVDRVLAREPEQRFDSATEFAAALTGAGPALRWRRRRAWRLLLPVGLAAALLGGGAWWANRPRSPSAAALLHRQITSRGDVRQVALSGDGVWLAYTAGNGDSVDVMVRDLGSGTEQALYRSAAVFALRWGAGGDQLYLRTSSGALLLPRDGGPPSLLPRGAGRLLGPDDQTFLRWIDFSNGLWVSSRADTAKRSVYLDGLTHIEHATFGPTARLVAVAGDSAGGGNTRLWVADLEGPSRYYIATAPGPVLDLAWGRSGSLTYLALHGSAADLWHQRLRPDGRPVGHPALLASGLPVAPGSKYTQGLLSVSNSGTTAAVVRTLIETQVRRTRRDGHDTILTSGTSLRYSPAFDGAGRRLAYFADEGETRALLITTTDGAPVRRMRGRFRSFSWHPAGRLIALVTDDSLPALAVLDLASGTLSPVPGAIPGGSADVVWGADSQLVYVTRENRGLAETSLRSGTTRMVIPDSVGWAFNPEQSPDGRQVAFLWGGGATTPQRVYLANLTTGEVRGVGPPGNWRPLGWSADGRAVFVMRWRESGDRRILRLDLATSSLTPHLDLPTPVWPWDVDLSADGEEAVYVDVRRQGDAWVMEGLPAAGD